MLSYTSWTFTAAVQCRVCQILFTLQSCGELNALAYPKHWSEYKIDFIALSPQVTHSISNEHKHIQRWCVLKVEMTNIYSHVQSWGSPEPTCFLPSANPHRGLPRTTAHTVSKPAGVTTESQLGLATQTFLISFPMNGRLLQSGRHGLNPQQSGSEGERDLCEKQAREERRGGTGATKVHVDLANEEGSDLFVTFWLT